MGSRGGNQMGKKTVEKSMTKFITENGVFLYYFVHNGKNKTEREGRGFRAYR